ncbi:hypothetical protein RCL_jg26274.t1 [Rhizophagus clarus]|uniref:Uncharacterized protein n=1 Tax=Rhizophagus clarus TaxID=94130 RepID=A0A8H3KZ08_9GLOM|nr:hypothetical protein RCL_jg26274.t1 [Rhizophagus clarus]
MERRKSIYFFSKSKRKISQFCCKIYEESIYRLYYADIMISINIEPRKMILPDLDGTNQKIDLDGRNQKI